MANGQGFVSSGSQRVQGVDAMLRKLDELDKKVKRKVLRDGVGKTARSMAKNVKQRVPTRTKALKKAIAAKTQFRDGMAVGEVGAKRGKSAPHLHLVEFGTVGRIQTTTGRRTGYMPAHPILRPALKTAAKELPKNLREAFRKATGAS